MKPGAIHAHARTAKCACAHRIPEPSKEEALAQLAHDLGETDALARLIRKLSGEAGASAATRAAYLMDAHLLLKLIAQQLPAASPIQPPQARAAPQEGHTTTLARLQRGNFTAFLRQLRREGHGASSIARYLSAWRYWYALLRQEGCLAVDPLAGVKPPRSERKLPQVPDAELLATFLDRFTQMPAEDPHTTARICRDHAIFELMYSSGLRVAEVAALDLADRLEKGALLHVQGKGGKQRLSPVGGRAQAALARWLEQREGWLMPHTRALSSHTTPIQTSAQPSLACTPANEECALFLASRGGRIGVREIQRSLATWSLKLGLPMRLHPHQLRHACASDFLSESGDLRATQTLLGHASLRSTQRYTHLDFQRLAQVYDAAHPRAIRRHTGD